MVLEVVPLRAGLLKTIVIFVATLCARLANDATPPDAVAVSVPCNVPPPAPRAAVTTVLLSLLRKLPNWSSMRSCGCGENATPAVAVVGGWVRIVNLFAAAGPTVTLEDRTDGMDGTAGTLKAKVMVSAVL